MAFLFVSFCRFRLGCSIASATVWRANAISAAVARAFLGQIFSFKTTKIWYRATCGLWVAFYISRRIFVLSLLVIVFFSSSRFFLLNVMKLKDRLISLRSGHI